MQPAGSGCTFTVDVSNETLAAPRSANGSSGRRVNLERALKAGDELGGHIVAGHVDGVGRIVDMRADGESRRFTVEAPAELARYIAAKGSVALDGISLTVNEVEQRRFGINIIPHTLTHTTLGARRARRPGQPRSRPDRALRGAARSMEFQR